MKLKDPKKARSYENNARSTYSTACAYSVRELICVRERRSDDDNLLCGGTLLRAGGVCPHAREICAAGRRTHSDLRRRQKTNQHSEKRRTTGIYDVHERQSDALVLLAVLDSPPLLVARGVPCMTS